MNFCLLAVNDHLPTFQEMVTYYGPYLGLLVSLVIVMLVLQYRWFKKLCKAKDDEISRLISNNKELNDRVVHMIDKEIGYRNKK